MTFTFVTLFENLIRFYFEDSILKRALQKGCFDIDFINPRDFTKDKHKKVDDYQAGGGAGLLLAPQPLWDALDFVKAKSKNAYFIFPTPAGKPFKQADAKRLSDKYHIVFVSGRYEGIDERVIEEFADEVFSIGDFVLTGGELPSLVMCDSICRNIRGVLGNIDSLNMESFEGMLLEAPTYTKPNTFRGKDIPKEFLKGNHGKITALKRDMAILKTKYYRPDLYLRAKRILDEK